MWCRASAEQNNKISPNGLAGGAQNGGATFLLYTFSATHIYTIKIVAEWRRTKGRQRHDSFFMALVCRLKTGVALSAEPWDRTPYFLSFGFAISSPMTTDAGLYSTALGSIAKSMTAKRWRQCVQRSDACVCWLYFVQGKNMAAKRCFLSSGQRCF